MKALILNSGLGKRMGELTRENPKCMVHISENETIISRQIKMLIEHGINEIIITTGALNEVLELYIKDKFSSVDIQFIYNSVYTSTNYIYSIYKAASVLHDDLILMHGDLVFDEEVLINILNSKESCMIVCENLPLPEKDFKAVVKENIVTKIGIEFFEKALPCQPLYKLKQDAWEIWLKRIIEYCERGEVNCYAEKAFNEVSEAMKVHPLYIGDLFCKEIDNVEDLEIIREYLEDK